MAKRKQRPEKTQAQLDIVIPVYGQPVHYDGTAANLNRITTTIKLV